MINDEMGIDLEKIRTITNCLIRHFHDLYIGGEGLTLFVFQEGMQRGELQFNSGYLHTLHPRETLPLFLESTVMPAILANPNRRIEVHGDGAITVSNT